MKTHLYQRVRQRRSPSILMHAGLSPLAGISTAQPFGIGCPALLASWHFFTSSVIDFGGAFKPAQAWRKQVVATVINIKRILITFGQVGISLKSLFRSCFNQPQLHYSEQSTLRMLRSSLNREIIKVGYIVLNR